ncbi:MAG: HNH endonuclease [Gammaproteobacteria bacterium]|nr:HNH endonuclease [Gammaproteobacteria bacterium]
MKLSLDFQFSIEVTRSNGIVVQASRRSWDRLRQIVKRRDGSICQYCGEETLDGHVDHIIPLSRGGTDSIDNLLWSCAFCNISKGAKPLDEFAEYRRQPLENLQTSNALDLTEILTSELKPTLIEKQAVGSTRVIITSVNTMSSALLDYPICGISL